MQMQAVLCAMIVQAGQRLDCMHTPAMQAARQTCIPCCRSLNRTPQQLTSPPQRRTLHQCPRSDNSLLGQE